MKTTLTSLALLCLACCSCGGRQAITMDCHYSNTVIAEDYASNCDNDTGGNTLGQGRPSRTRNGSPIIGNPADPSGQFSIGDFTILLDTTGQLTAYHSDDSSHRVFQSAPAPWFSVSEVVLNTSENQGSFDIDITESFSCLNPSFQDTRSANGVLHISGIFEDTNAECQGTTFTVEISQSGQGRLEFSIRPESSSDINRISIQIESDPDEHIFGMGEQFPHNSFNLNGRQIEVLSQEGGIGRGRPLISSLINIASSGSSGTEGTTYYSAPHYLTNQLHSIFLKNTAYAQFDFQRDSVTEIRLFEDSITWEALYGTSPLQLIERFTAYAGRMPTPPNWTQNGAILAMARPLDDGLVLLEKLTESGAAIAGVWNQTWSGVNDTFIGEQVLWNWILNEDEHPAWHEWVSTLNSYNIRALCYVNPMFLNVSDITPAPRRNLFEEGQAAGHFVKNGDGETLLLPVTAFDVSLLDLTSETAREWMKAILIEELVENAGCDGWMVDFAEALPFHANLHDGSNPVVYHNRYPVEWMRLNREAIEEAGLLGEVLTFNRSGHTLSPNYSLMFWQGDQLTTWDRYDGITSALRGLINGGFSGLALNHSDTGGYTSLSLLGIGYDRSSELTKRWAEMSAFTSLLRTHEGNQPHANTQSYDDNQLDHFSWATRVYAGLAEYRSTLFFEAEQYGWPVARHLWLHYPNDQMALTVDDQFMFGEGFLVAPILEPCSGFFSCRSEREVYLPQGNWTNLWTGEDFEGPTTIDVVSPLKQPPVFYLMGHPRAVSAVEALRQYDVGVH